MCGACRMRTGLRREAGKEQKEEEAVEDITLRGLDDTLTRALRERARIAGRALEEVIVEILRESCRSDEELRSARRVALAGLAGTWEPEEAEQFERALAEQRKINVEDWR